MANKTVTGVVLVASETERLRLVGREWVEVGGSRDVREVGFWEASPEGLKWLKWLQEP